MLLSLHQRFGPEGWGRAWDDWKGEVMPTEMHTLTLWQRSRSTNQPRPPGREHLALQEVWRRKGHQRSRVFQRHLWSFPYKGKYPVPKLLQMPYRSLSLGLPSPEGWLHHDLITSLLNLPRQSAGKSRRWRSSWSSHTKHLSTSCLSPFPHPLLRPSAGGQMPQLVAWMNRTGWTDCL